MVYHGMKQREHVYIYPYKNAKENDKKITCVIATIDWPMRVT